MRIGADISRDRLLLEGLAPRLIVVGLGLGLLGFAGALALVLTGEGEADWGGFLRSYLVNYAFYLSLALGCLFFVILQYLVRAGWSIAVRRVAEAFAANLWLMTLLLLPILLGLHELYEWTHAEVVAGDKLLQHKEPYLNSTFFIIRCAIYCLVWIGLSQLYFRASVKQDRSGDPAVTLRLEKWSAPGMFLFALTLTFASFDLLMSTDPHWYSTIFGVYYFSGSVLGCFALMALSLVLLQRSGRLTHAITAEHYHDMGKLLFAFLVFWAYIAFSQFMLIWYANIPEETVWYLRRQNDTWSGWSLALVFGHFLIPFLAFLSRHPKRRGPTLALMSAWILLMHWIDLYWLVLPNASPEQVPFGLVDVALFVGMAGLFLAAAANRMRRHALIPLKDPRLAESLAFENV